MIIKSTPCGFECDFPNLESLWKFFDFSKIDFGSYYFHSADSFVLLGGRMDRLVVFPSQFSSDYFEDLVCHSFVAEYLVIHLYPESTPSEVIGTYADYVKSPCEMIILLYDGSRLELYCKNPSWLEVLVKMAQEIPDTVFRFKYEETDPRTEMYV